MEWSLVGIVPVAVVLRRLTRVRDTTSQSLDPGAVGVDTGTVGRSAAGVPLDAAVARRAMDPDNPDGAFMDGYVAGRYTERLEKRANT